MDTELGYAAGVIEDAATWGRTARHVVDPLEANPDLRFPHSVAVWDVMRRSDDQVGAVLRAINLPIRRARWTLDAEGVRPEVAAFVAAELGMDTGEGRARQRRHGVVWAEHVREALLSLPLGFMPFEQVYAAEVGGEWAGRLGLPGVFHLRKLAARMPSTVAAIRVGRDGGLEGIVQTPHPADVWTSATFEDGGVFIPVDRLVMYTHEREGADWSGTSILRQAYRPWYVRDALIRLDAQAAERNGMGVPVITYTSPEQKAEAERIGRQFRAGAAAYAALSKDMTLELQGVSGGTHDVLSSIKYHGEQIGKSVLAMFLDLGHDAGARSLGDTFQDAFLDSLQAVADQLADTATEHIVRDLVEANLGPDEPYPVIKAGDLRANSRITVDALKGLADARIITPDAALEDQVRRDYGLPDAVRRAPAGAEGDAPEAAGPEQSPEDLQKRGAYAGLLIRSGFDPADAMRSAGLDPVKHLGLLPVTVQPPAKGTDLDNAVPTNAAAALSSPHDDHAHALDLAQQALAQVRAMRERP